MGHNAKCEYAKGDVCKCECDGELHGIKTRDSDRKNLIGDWEGRCLKCGSKIYLVKKWAHFYCNNYCCNPCCPDAKKTPCTKERIEMLNTPELKEALKYKMRTHIFRVRNIQTDIRSIWRTGAK